MLTGPLNLEIINDGIYATPYMVRLPRKISVRGTYGGDMLHYQSTPFDIQLSRDLRPWCSFFYYGELTEATTKANVENEFHRF